MMLKKEQQKVWKFSICQNFTSDGQTGFSSNEYDGDLFDIN